VARTLRRLGLEVLRLAFAVVGGYVGAVSLESTCPAPTPENSSPGCEGPSYVFGAVAGFLVALFATIVAQLLWRRFRPGRT
jgi:uncharacterized membrane protein YfcA